MTHLLAFSSHLQLILKIQGSLPERFLLNVKVYKDLHMLLQLFIPESQENIWDSVPRDAPCPPSPLAGASTLRVGAPGAGSLLIVPSTLCVLPS